MKKYNLNSTWKYCVEMWDWIAKVWGTPRYKHFGVWRLKQMWRKKHGFEVGETAADDCFFCVYAGYKGLVRIPCSKCPGRLVSKHFDCFNTAYHWYSKPVKFAAEINRLNKIRKGKPITR